MSKRTYHPDRGDLITINFVPAAGREIDKRRPAIVLTPIEYNRASGLCIVVPTSTNLSPASLRIPLPPGILDRSSLILCDYVKSFDYRERSAEFLAKVPPEVVDAVVSNIIDLIDPIK